MILTKTQYTFVIILGFLMLLLNGYLVFKVLNDKIPKQCPVPEEVKFCDCVYNALGSKSLRYCTCYAGERIDLNEIIKEVENGSS